jgi:uncharacterized membrane protein
VDLVGLGTIATGLAAVVAVIISILDRQERRRRRQKLVPPAPPQTSPEPFRRPAPGPMPPATPPQTDPQPFPGSLPGPMLEPAPTAWGAPVPPVDTRHLAIGIQGVLAYLLGIIGGLVFLFSRHREVRYHALQSIGIDVLTVLYLVAVTVVGVTYSLVRYGEEPIPNSDPVLNAAVAGLFLVEMLPRFYCVVQILRVKPARIPLIWRVAATLAARRGER